MRYGNRLHQKISNGKIVLTVEQAQIVTAIAAASAGGAVRQVHRDLELTRQRRDATAVIRMLVGYQDCIQLAGLDVEACQTPDCFSQRKTTIDHYQRIASFNQGGIALATRTERGELHRLIPQSRQHDLVNIALDPGQHLLLFTLIERNTCTLRF